MAKYIVYNSLAAAQADQLIFDKKLGYRNENGDPLYATQHAFDIIKHPTQELWAIHLETVAGTANAEIEFKKTQLPLKALSGKKIIWDIVGDGADIKTEGQLKADDWFVKYDLGQPIEGTY